MIITFDEQNHAYTDEQGNQFPSPTQILGVVYGTGLENAPKFFVDRAAEKGHITHAEIDNFLKTGQEGESAEFRVWHRWWTFAARFDKYENEKIVYAQTPSGAFAGTLDFYANGWLWDWKTSKTATKAQIEKWTMQLSFYCYAMRQMGYVVNEPLKILHITDKFSTIHIKYLGDKFVEETMAKYKDIVAGKAVQQVKPAPEQELQTVSPKDIALLEDTLFQIETLEKVVADIRGKIKDEMERRGILDVQIGKVKVTYIPGTIRQTFDSKSFQKDDPYMYQMYLRDSHVKPSVRITVK